MSEKRVQQWSAYHRKIHFKPFLVNLQHLLSRSNPAGGSAGILREDGFIFSFMGKSGIVPRMGSVPDIATALRPDLGQMKSLCSSVFPICKMGHDPDLPSRAVMKPNSLMFTKHCEIFGWKAQEKVRSIISMALCSRAPGRSLFFKSHSHPTHLIFSPPTPACRVHFTRSCYYDSRS